MDFLQSSLGNYLMNLKKENDSKLPALQDNQNIDPNLDMMLNREITSPDYGKVPIKFPQTPSTVNNLSALMNVNAPSKTIKAGTPPTGAQAIAPAGTTTTGQPAKSQGMATGTESPKPQEDDFGNRMAATAVGNILGSLGAGLAGYSPTSVNQMFQGLYTQLNQKQKEKEVRDPNSQISKNYRDLVSPYLPKGLDISNKSAFELEKVIPFAMQKAQQEQQMEIARMNASASRQNSTAIRELSQRRFEQNIQNKAFGDIEKEYTKLFSPEDSDFRRSLYEARDLAKQIGVGKGTIQRLATGVFKPIAGPSGAIDPKASALAIKLGQLETYLAKDTGEVGNLTADERKPYRDNLPKINDANKVQFFNEIISTHEAKRNDRVNRFTAKVDRVNKNYGTNFNPMENLKEIEGFDVTPEETSTPNIKIPKFDLKL